MSIRLQYISVLTDGSTAGPPHEVTRGMIVTSSKYAGAAGLSVELTVESAMAQA